MDEHPSDRPAFARGLLLSILYIAANLRAPIIGVGPLLDQIRGSFGMGSAQAGVLTALPVVAFATVSPFCARLFRRHGLERTLLAALILLTAGILLRSTGPLWALFTGTAVMGCAIAMGNVLLPTLVMRDFPDRVSTITTMYVVSMGGAGAAYSPLVAPLFQMTGSWRVALALWAAPALLAVLIWLPQVRRRATVAPPPRIARRPAQPLWRSPLAWQVTSYMGLNSFTFYVIISWLPAMLQARGYSLQAAGTLHGMMQAVGILPLVVVMPLLQRLKDQRAMAFATAACGGVGFLGLALHPQWAIAWVTIYGAGSGIGLVLALSFSSLRASNVDQAAALAGMAQSVGYVLAAIGPALAGALRDALGSWTPALFICAAAASVQAGLGLFAGRAVKLAPETPEPTVA